MITNPRPQGVVSGHFLNNSLSGTGTHTYTDKDGVFRTVETTAEGIKYSSNSMCLKRKSPKFPSGILLNRRNDLGDGQLEHRSEFTNLYIGLSVLSCLADYLS